MKYTIKAFIKDKNETVSSVANKLQLSRPTFDTYIMIYEEGLPLPKAKYQRIFDSLFSDYYISSNAFKERLDMCETILTSGMQYNSIEFLTRRADRVSTLIERIRQNINFENLDERFVLIYTGQRRLARNLLRDVSGRYVGNEPELWRRFRK